MKKCLQFKYRKWSDEIIEDEYQAPMLPSKKLAFVVDDKELWTAADCDAGAYKKVIRPTKRQMIEWDLDAYFDEMK